MSPDITGPTGDTTPVWKFQRSPTDPIQDVHLDEPWIWQANYSDGTSLKQYGDDGRFHRIAEVRQDALASFMMISVATGQTVTFLWRPGMKLICFYHNRILRVGTPEELHIRMPCFGYEIPEKKAKLINVILPDGSIAQVEEVSQVILE